MTAQHPANQARNAPKATGNKKKAAHTSSTKTPPSPKPVNTPTRGEDSKGRRGNPEGWKVVEVLWVDAIADGLHEWLAPEEAELMKPEDSLVVGYLLVDSPEFVTVGSLINDDHVAHTLCVPRSLIVQMRELS